MAPSPPNASTAPMAMTINPAAGPLIVNSELLMHDVTIAPTIAVKTPAMAGYPDASAIPRHNGSAMRNTKNPETTSFEKYFANARALPRGTSSSLAAGDLGSKVVDMDYGPGSEIMKSDQA